MSAALYQERLLALAKSGAGAGDAPAGTGVVGAKRTNPMCGDEVEVWARLTAGRIAALSHRTRGCLLCRAAAAALAETATGMSADAARGLIADFSRMMCEDGKEVDGLEMFAPAAARPSRRKCALLPFLALAEILNKAEERSADAGNSSAPAGD